MSIADLKTRLADVPGIQNLSMMLQGGKIMLRWAETHMAAVDAAAGDSEVVDAVRAASRLPGMGSLVSIPPATPAAAPISQEVKPMATDVTGGVTAGASIRDMLENHKHQMADLLEGHKATMQEGFDKQIRAVTAIGGLAASINRDGDDLLALVGQYTNEL